MKYAFNNMQNKILSVGNAFFKKEIRKHAALGSTSQQSSGLWATPPYAPPLG
jgi:hypothetical protein